MWLDSACAAILSEFARAGTRGWLERLEDADAGIDPLHRPLRFAALRSVEVRPSGRDHVSRPVRSSGRAGLYAAFSTTEGTAQAIGSPSWRTLLRHVWPNITAPIIIIYSITIGWAIIAEASLSFLGFGLPPDVPSWGTMLSREGRQYMEMAPRLAMWSGVALTLVVYCLNMVGDALRDLLDPRLRGGGGVAGGVGARAAERATKALQKLERSR